MKGFKKMSMIKKALTIAGSDSSGGAGIQADIKTMTVNGVYAMSAVTAVTAQNTMGVSSVFAVPGEMIEAQLRAVFEDIYPDSVKIGMLPNTEAVEVTAHMLKKYGARNIVTDPVMISTSGKNLMSGDAAETAVRKIFPISDLITPNIHETEYITGLEICDIESMVSAGKELLKTGAKNVLVKGGHLENENCDVLISGDGSVKLYRGQKINNPNNHGTGCTLSSAIACSLAKGSDIKKAVGDGKAYITELLLKNFDIGKGNGPMLHFRLNDKV